MNHTEKSPCDDAIIIKKYANRRLYNTQTSSYIVLEDLAFMIKEGVDFVVYDAKIGDDITRSVLTQIIFEEESKGNFLLPLSFLRDMIKLYGTSVSPLYPEYWEASMDFFKHNQEKMRSSFEHAIENVSMPFTHFQKVADNHRLFMQKTFDMFTHFGSPTEEHPTKKNACVDTEGVITLRKEIYDAMQAELITLREQVKQGKI